MRAPDPVITLSPVLDADSSSAHLISLRIPAPIGHQAQHPAPIGRGMAPQVARAQLPVAAARIVSPASISSALASERNIDCSAPPVCVCALLRYLEDLCGNIAAYCTTPEPLVIVRSSA